MKRGLAADGFDPPEIPHHEACFPAEDRVSCGERVSVHLRVPAMLEIVILFLCGKKIAEICNRKGRAGWPWVLMMIGFWIGGAIAGAIAALIVATVADPDAEEPNLIMLLVGYIGGAALGMVLTFVIVSALPAAGGQDDDDEYDDRPRRRSRRRPRRLEEEEDVYDRPPPDRRGRGNRYGGRGEFEDDDDRLDRGRRSDERDRY